MKLRTDLLELTEDDQLELLREITKLPVKQSEFPTLFKLYRLLNDHHVATRSRFME